MPSSDDKNVVMKKVRLERVYPEELVSHYVSNLVVQHEPEVFIISFFEVWPPAILGDTDEEKQQALEALDHVEAKCVARLVVTANKMREFVKILSDNLASYDQKKMAMGLDWEKG